MSNTSFFVWATPAFVPGSPVDHTWVTTYDNRQISYADIQKVISAHQHYWFSWGDFHPTGGLLGTRPGDLASANCLVLTNADSRKVAGARGTIFKYGVDGVCHQRSNQILFATRGAQGQPLTVASARGYGASSYLYGTYGMQQAAWAHKLGNCGQTVGFSDAARTPSMADLPDDFEARARSVLESRDPRLLEQLLALRAQSQQSFVEEFLQAAPSAEALNAHNQRRLDEAAKLLGRDKFIEVFGFPPEERIHLVDPAFKPPTE